MLLVALLLLASGYVLMYAGLSRKGYWRAPWEPITQTLGQA